MPNYTFACPEHQEFDRWLPLSVERDARRFQPCEKCGAASKRRYGRFYFGFAGAVNDSTGTETRIHEATRKPVRTRADLEDQAKILSEERGVNIYVQDDLDALLGPGPRSVEVKNNRKVRSITKVEHEREGRNVDGLYGPARRGKKSGQMKIEATGPVTLTAEDAGIDIGD